MANLSSRLFSDSTVNDAIFTSRGVPPRSIAELDYHTMKRMAQRPSDPFTHDPSRDFKMRADMVDSPFALTQTMQAAERELAAFLRAIIEVVGAKFQQKAENLWIRILETADWDGESPEQFFRLISVSAIAQLTGCMEEHVTV
jgi:hypothetical protein